MLAKQDINTLDEAGVKIDNLAAAAAAFIRTHPIHVSSPMVNALAEHEEAFLKQGGAVGVGEFKQANLSENVTVIAGEYAQMVSTGYSQRETANILGVTTSRIRQRIDDHSLYSINGPAGRICPQFQFMDKGTLPGQEKVLSAINENAHPVAVQRFFLSKNPDLESETLDEILSPRDWLLTGHAIEPVVLLAREL